MYCGNITSFSMGSFYAPELKLDMHMYDYVCTYIIVFPQGIRRRATSRAHGRSELLSSILPFSAHIP